MDYGSRGYVFVPSDFTILQSIATTARSRIVLSGIRCPGEPCWIISVFAAHLSAPVSLKSTDAV